MEYSLFETQHDLCKYTFHVIKIPTESHIINHSHHIITITCTYILNSFSPSPTPILPSYLPIIYAHMGRSQCKLRRVFVEYKNNWLFLYKYSSFFMQIRGDVKIQVLAIARFCKGLQTLATKGLLTLSQVCQPLASNGNQSPFSRYSSNDILISLTAH